jgi:hypothetical protein
MSHNIFQPYLLCINVHIIGIYRTWRLIHWCLMCAVCLSVSLHLSVPWYLSEGPDSSKYAGINGAMNDVLICNKFHLLCLDNTFMRKTKNLNVKNSFDFVKRSTSRKRKKTTILRISEMNTLQLAISLCLNCFRRDTLQSVDPSALCW